MTGTRLLPTYYLPLTATRLLPTYLFKRVCMHALTKADVEENVDAWLHKPDGLLLEGGGRLSLKAQGA